MTTLKTSDSDAAQFRYSCVLSSGKFIVCGNDAATIYVYHNRKMLVIGFPFFSQIILFPFVPNGVSWNVLLRHCILGTRSMGNTHRNLICVQAVGTCDRFSALSRLDVQFDIRQASLL